MITPGEFEAERNAMQKEPPVSESLKSDGDLTARIHAYVCALSNEELDDLNSDLDKFFSPKQQRAKRIEAAANLLRSSTQSGRNAMTRLLNADARHNFLDDSDVRWLQRGVKYANEAIEAYDKAEGEGK